ncbi:MAG: LacI family transcriptional regulator, partial [Verrucomicrobia bacterium]|nr:LacI family transcriptional regulator [Verrucomicrobiota bacterium]
ATASRVLSGQGSKFRIPPETAQSVVEAARRLGYSLNRRNFKPEGLRSRTLGLVIPDLSHPFLSQLARTVVERAHAAGYSVLVADSLEDTAQERQLIEQLTTREIDGLLLLPVGREWEHVRELTQRKLPLVLIDRIHPGIVNHSVSVDNYQAAYEATEYLLTRGHRRIACIQRLPEAWINEERVRGYREAHRAHGVKVDDALVLGRQFGGHNGYLEVKRLLELKARPSAIFALGVFVTLEALRALRDHKLSVPEDISLLGFDDLPHAEFFNQPITTVRQPVAEMARMAMDLMIDQIEQRANSGPMAIQLPCELVRRHSVSVL